SRGRVGEGAVPALLLRALPSGRPRRLARRALRDPGRAGGRRRRRRRRGEGVSETRIHPTALVDPAAELGSGVTVGPFSVIEAGVVVGAGTEIHSHVRLFAGTTLGRDNVVHAGAFLGGA